MPVYYNKPNTCTPAAAVAAATHISTDPLLALAFNLPNSSFFHGVSRNNNTPSLPTNLDFVETESNYIIKVDIPGIPKENINIQTKGDVLIIEGERANEYITAAAAEGSPEKASTQKQEQPQYKKHYSQRSFGKFKREVELPEDLNVDQVEANVANGVLTLTFSKKAVNDGVKTIKIQ